MRLALWPLLLLAGLSARGGTVDPWGMGVVLTGSLTVTGSGVKIEGAGASEVKLGDILAANFGSGPVTPNYYSSAEHTAFGLPEGWKVENIGSVEAPGKASFTGGVFDILGAQWERVDDGDEHFTYLYRPWSGDGQWTMRVTSIPNGFPRAGIVLRDSTAPKAASYGMATWDNNNAFMFGRSKRQGTFGSHFDAYTFPQWFRLTRRGDHMVCEFSTDGVKWDSPGQFDIDLNTDCLIGFFFAAMHGKSPKLMVFDHVLFTPAPGLPLQGGLLLRSGSFLAGCFNPLDFLSADPTGKFTRPNGDSFQLSSTQACAQIYCPIEASRVAETAAQVGALLPNGDFMQGTWEAINGGGVRIDSLTFGTETYQRNEVSAATLHPLSPIPGDVEVRLNDGSRLEAKGLAPVGDKVTIHEVSGLDLTVAPGEIAQIRAGSARVADLLDAPWKIVPGAGAKATSAFCWAGASQAQVLALATGEQAEFSPSGGAFRALAFRAELASGTNEPVTLHVLADGKPIDGGDTVVNGTPLLVKLPLKAAKTITLAAEAKTAERVLIVDPVAIRTSAP
jgi:hypothetical protein